MIDSSGGIYEFQFSIAVSGLTRTNAFRQLPVINQNTIRPIAYFQFFCIVPDIVFPYWDRLHNQRSFQHFFIKINILAGGNRMIEQGRTLLHNSFNLPIFYPGGQLVKIQRLIDGPGESLSVKCFKKKAVAGVTWRVDGGNCVMDTAGIMSHRQGPVDGADHLGQTAGFEKRGHENKISSPVGQMLKVFIEIADGNPVMQLMKCHDISEMRLIFTIGDKYELELLVPVPGYDIIQDAG